MRGIRYESAVKAEVEKLRMEGKTYSEIQSIYSIPKSTLSVWLGKKYAGVFDRNAQLEHLKRVRKLAVAKITKNRRERYATYEARAVLTAEKVPTHNKEIQKSLLAMLYWAEGKKGGGALTFANTDPQLVLLYISMLRNCFDLEEKRIQVRLHLHYYHPKKESVRYWSKLLHVPETQFGKLFVKKRSASKKFRRNFQGICFVTYGDTAILREILALGRAIAKRI